VFAELLVLCAEPEALFQTQLFSGSLFASLLVYCQSGFPDKNTLVPFFKRVSKYHFQT
jgi:hypothetical protein